MATVPAPPATAAPIDFAKLSADYITLRDAKLAAKKQWEALEEQYDNALTKIEMVMLTHLNAHGTDSMKTPGGTFYKQEKIKPNIVDDAAFFQWIKDNDAFDALQRRVAVGTIKQFMEAHDGGLPPGIHVSREWEVVVRRPQ